MDTLAIGSGRRTQVRGGARKQQVIMRNSLVIKPSDAEPI